MNKSVTPPTKFCPKCNKYHLLHYVQNQFRQLSLWVDCPKGVHPIKYVPGLDIPTVQSKRLRKQEQQAKQPNLL